MSDEKTEERIVIDLRRSGDAPSKELDADLIMEIDLFDTGYQAAYHMKSDGKAHSLLFQRDGLTREAMIAAHIEAITLAKPKTALVRTGSHSSGHVRDILLHPGVVKSIIEGKLGAEDLILRS